MADILPDPSGHGVLASGCLEEYLFDVGGAEGKAATETESTDSYRK